MALTAIAAMLIAAAPDAGTLDAGTWIDDPIYAECPHAPAPTQLDDGSYKLPPLRAARNACLMGACEDDRQRLKAGPPVISAWTLLFGAVCATLAVIGGFYLGIEWHSISGH
jgi:hypothetical protein